MSYKFDIFSGGIPFFRRVLRAVFTLLSPSAGCYSSILWCHRSAAVCCPRDTHLDKNFVAAFEQETYDNDMAHQPIVHDISCKMRICRGGHLDPTVCRFKLDLIDTVCYPLYVAVCRLRNLSDDVGTSRYEPLCPVDVRPERAIVAAVVIESQNLENQ